MVLEILSDSLALIVVSFWILQVGYLYPVPAQSVASATRAQLNFPPLALPRPSANLERLPSASAQEPSIQQVWTYPITL